MFPASMLNVSKPMKSLHQARIIVLAVGLQDRAAVQRRESRRVKGTSCGLKCSSKIQLSKWVAFTTSAKVTLSFLVPVIQEAHNKKIAWLQIAAFKLSTLTWFDKILLAIFLSLFSAESKKLWADNFRYFLLI